MMTPLGALTGAIKVAGELAAKTAEKAVEVAATEVAVKAGEKIVGAVESAVKKAGTLAEVDLSGLPGRGGLTDVDLSGLPGQGGLADADLSGLPGRGEPFRAPFPDWRSPMEQEPHGKYIPETPEPMYADQKSGEKVPEKAEKPDVQPKEGGSYREVKENSNGVTHEVHHVPADSISPLEHGEGPAIKMEKGDHQQTASYGSSREARDYRAAQQELINDGKFREAIQMDIDDIHGKFGSKYDGSISQMMDYVGQLEKEGKINA